MQAAICNTAMWAYLKSLTTWVRIAYSGMDKCATKAEALQHCSILKCHWTELALMKLNLCTAADDESKNNVKQSQQWSNNNVLVSHTVSY